MFVKKFRVVFFLFLISGVIGVSVILVQEKPKSTFSRSLAPLFQELGKPVKSLDRAISRVLPIDEIDEKMLGDEIKLRFNEIIPAKTIDDEALVQYLNSLISSLCKESKRELEYRVFLIEGPLNAFALPGGVICITNTLLDALENEAELIAILSHEMGHIERGHLFDAARGEMLKRKVKQSSIFSYASDTAHKIMGLCFSKAQEDEADEYAFRMLIKKGYNPMSMSNALEKLIIGSTDQQTATNPFRDFFTTHLYTKLRVEKFRSKAILWNENYPDEKKSFGKKSIKNKRL